MNDIVAGVSVIGVVLGVVEALKQAGLLPSRYAALAAALLGAIITSAVGIADASFSVISILTGIALGLSASGLYSGVKAVTE